jgi:hypothetical protein
MTLLSAAAPASPMATTFAVLAIVSRTFSRHRRLPARRLGGHVNATALHNVQL